MQAFIFDFDGVIVDSQKYWDSHTLEMFQTLVPSWTKEDNLKPRGLSVADSYELLKNEYGFTGKKDDFLRYWDEFALEMYHQKAQIIDGIQHLLDRLHQLNIPVGIATASRSMWLHSTLDLHGIRHRFMATSSSDDVAQSKPHPEVYLRTATALSVDPTECVALEDSTQGLTSAKAAGMFAIGLQTADHLERAEDLALANMVITHPDELTTEVLERL